MVLSRANISAMSLTSGDAILIAAVTAIGYVAWLSPRTIWWLLFYGNPTRAPPGREPRRSSFDRLIQLHLSDLR